ncbi:hypothetical protein [Kocuria sabuli]|uniref:hypothetical protein n=1 Tax=Kocuria sabuli TaxID=3071448 RepID=UPI0034D743A4
MTDRADEETPRCVTFQPLLPRVAIAVAFLIAMTLVFVSMPDGPWHLTIAPFYVVGSLSYWLVMNRTVVLRLEDHVVRIRLGRRTVEIPYEQITEATVGPRTPWWQIGRRRMDDGSTGYLMGGTSVRITTGETSVLVSAEEPYRVAGAIQRQCEHSAEDRAADTEQAGR